MHKIFIQQLRQSKTRGAALILTIFFFVMISLAIIQSATIGVISELKTYRSLVTSKYSYIAAEVGIEDLYYRTITNKQLPVSNSETFILNNASSTVTVNTISSSEKEFYSNGDASSRVRKIYMKTSKTATPIFYYGAQVGRGGIVMNNNARVISTALDEGNVYSNGAITGSNGAYVTGSATVASGISADITASSTVCTTEKIIGQTGGARMYAQSFYISTSSPDTLAKVSLLMSRTGSPAAATVYITTDNAGKPSTTSLASQSLTNSMVTSVSPTIPSMVNVIFTSPPALSPSTKYWIVLSSPNHASRYYRWCANGGTGTLGDYTSGDARTSTTAWTTSPVPTWTSVTPSGADMGFKIYLGGGESLINGVDVSETAKADTITGSDVGGDAYYQTINGGTTIAGTAHAGSPTPPEIGMPISASTLTAWQEEAATGGTITGNCGSSGVAGCNTFPLTLGPKKIVGNLTLGNGESLTISGTLYVTGNITLSNNSTIRCAVSYLANSCKLITSGSADISNNGLFFGSGTPGSFVFLISSIAGCLGPGTTAGTGCAANNSGINLYNNVDGALFYTTNSAIYISNNAVVKAVVGYRLVLDNNGTIQYDSLVRNLTLTADGGAGEGAAWNVNRWNEY